MRGLNANGYCDKVLPHTVYLSLTLLYYQTGSHQKTIHNLPVFGITINILM